MFEWIDYGKSRRQEFQKPLGREQWEAGLIILQILYKGLY